MKVHVTLPDGSKKEVSAIEGWTLMEIIRDGDLPIKAECGGACACATCHVYVDPAWEDRTGAKSEDEEDMLDLAIDVRANSRLSCQIEFKPELDGVEVTLAEDAIL